MRRSIAFVTRTSRSSSDNDRLVTLSNAATKAAVVGAMTGRQIARLRCFPMARMEGLTEQKTVAGSRAGVVDVGMRSDSIDRICKFAGGKAVAVGIGKNASLRLRGRR